jgi:hypothetical protein
MEERKIKPADFRLEDLDRDIIAREDELEYELFKLHLYEDEAQKAEAAAGSEIEGEMVKSGKSGWMDLSGKNTKSPASTHLPRPYLPAQEGMRLKKESKAQRKGKERYERATKPPSFGDSKVYRVPDGDYVIELQFERLGRNRRLEIKTSSLDADFIGSLPKELSTACRNIPHNEFVIPHILEHING